MENINVWQSDFSPCQYSDKLLNKVILLNHKLIKPIDINEVTKAIYYAKKYHGSQMRQSGEPYYSHPVEVAYIISDYLPITDIIVSSLLHDCIEDTSLTKSMISSIFNETIARQVMDLTRIKEDGRKISSAEMMEILYKEKKYDVALIKIFDRIDNLQTLYVKSPTKARKIIEETITHILTLAMQLNIPNIQQKIIELCFKNINQPLPKQWQKMVEDKFHFPETISQNVVTQIYNQYLQGS